jgi:prevent-host-death family protein
MGSLSVRELQRNVQQVLDRVQGGESVEVTHRRRAIARIMPVAAPSTPEPWPDLEARARKALGRLVIEPPASEQLLAARRSG